MTGLPAYLGITTVDVGPGTMTAELEMRPELLNPFGTAHGGVLTALVDHVLGSVLYPLIPRGAWAATTEFKVNLLAPVSDGVLRARSEVLAMTKRTAVVRIDVTNGDRLVGLAQGTVTISPRGLDSYVAAAAQLRIASGGERVAALRERRREQVIDALLGERESQQGAMASLRGRDRHDGHAMLRLRENVRAVDVRLGDDLFEGEQQRDDVVLRLGRGERGLEDRLVHHAVR